MDKKDKIYITGSSGMVGKNLIEKLTYKGYKNLIYKSSKELDLTDRKKVFDFFKKEKPTLVFHLAARVGGIKANIDSPVEFLSNNLLININIIDACFEFRVKKLLNLGSSCIYPKDIPQPMKEEDLMTGKLEPTNEGYSLSKICSLKLCQYYNKEYNTNFVSLMPPNLYGVYEKFDLNNSHVISSLIMRFHEAKIKDLPEIKIWGSGNARREFMYVDDVVDILIFSMHKINKEDIYDQCFLNTGTNEDISIKDLAYLISNIVGYKGIILFDSTKPEGMLRKLMDSSRAIKFGYKPKVVLKKGIDKTYKYYLLSR